jgi:hypothetical protein
MKQIDAAKVLGITGEMTPESIKKAYRLASAKYHPDRNPAGLEMMKAVNLAYETLKDFEGSLESGAEGYSDALNEILNRVMNMPGVIIEVCGAWIWLTGVTKPFSAELGRSGLGFYWASKKKAWYFRPDDWKSTSRGQMSLDDIRETYGSERVKNKQNNMLKAG